MSDDRRDAERALDLLYGEVEGADARALRASLEADPAGAETLARLERAKRLADTLPLVEMPSATRANLLAAAREAALARRGAQGVDRAERTATDRGREQAPEPARAGTAGASPSGGSGGSGGSVDLGPGGVQSGWLDRLLAGLRGPLLAPQLAMAAVVLLVVAVGMWTIPGQDPPAPAEVMRPDPAAAPRAIDPPAQPPAEPTAAPEVEVQRQGTAERLQVAEATEAALEDAEDGDGVRRRYDSAATRRARSASSEASGAPRRDTSLLDDRNVAERREELPASAGASGGAEGASVSEPVLLGRGARAPAAQAARANEPAPPADRYADMDEESAQLAPGTQGLAARTLHATAQSHRARGDCAQASRYYDQLLAQHPGYADMPRALLDAADCQRRLGRISQARILLVRAEGFPSTEAEARRELRRLETIQQATRRRAAPAAPSSLDSLAH